MRDTDITGWPGRLIRTALSGAIMFVMAAISAPVSMAQTTYTVCSKQGSELDLNHSRTSGMRAKLANSNYFGPGGTVAPEQMAFQSLSSVNSGSLAACDIFIGGGFPENLSVAETQAVRSWVNSGNRFVIAGCDSSTQLLCGPNGLQRNLTNISSGFGVSLSFSLAYNPLTCGGVAGVDTYGGAATLIAPLGTDSVLATHNGTHTGQPAAIAPDLVTPDFLMTADPDMFGSSGNGVIGTSSIASSDQAVFVLNSFKFAADALSGRLLNPQCPVDYNSTGDLEIALTASTVSASLGGAVDFEVEVANTGAVNVGDIEALFQVPAGFSYVSDAGPGTYDDATGVWTIGTLNPGDSATLTVSATATALGASQAQAEIINANLPDGDSAPNASFGVDDLADGLNDDDEAVLALSVSALDRSDATTSGTSYGEATHEIVSGFQLGAAMDADAAPIANADASGDGADDDGVTFPTLTQGQGATIPVSVTQVAGNDGYLQVWIDWNGDGDFADAGEQVATDLQSASAGTSTINVPLTVPVSATTSPTFARFRWSTVQGLDATSAAPDGEVEDYALTVQPGGITISGRVFGDNGAGGATAHDGLFAGDEAGLGGIRMEARNAGGAVIASAETDGDGLYTLALPDSAAGSPLTLHAARAGSEWRYIFGVPGDLPAPADTLAANGEVVFTPVSGAEYSGVDIGQVRDPVLAEPREASVTPGQSVVLAHTFTAHTSGLVDITLPAASVDTSPEGAFALSLIEDADCDGRIDAGETAPAASRVVSAGDTICLLVRAQADAAAPSGAAVSYVVLAEFGFAGTGASATPSNRDRVTVSDVGTLILTKQVCNSSAAACDVTTGAGFSAANTGAPGDTLVYRIMFENPGPDAIDDVDIHDDTPAFSALANSAPHVVSTPDGLACALSTPAAPVAGYTGNLHWSCAGTMASGDTGAVSFEVVVDD